MWKLCWITFMEKFGWVDSLPPFLKLKVMTGYYLAFIRCEVLTNAALSGMHQARSIRRGYA